MLLINLIIGSGLIIAGVYFFSNSLTSAFNDKIPVLFARVGNKPGNVFLASTVITAFLQSSTAISVLTIGFADSGILSWTSAMAAIYGANLGTCVTAQIMSLDIAEYGFYVLAFGIILKLALLLLKKRGVIADIFIALGLLLAGMITLRLSMPIIKGSPLIMEVIRRHGDNSFYLVILGFITTALVNSSSATIGVTMTMFSSGIISFTQAAYIVFGDNIGTCVTAQIAAKGAGINGKRVAVGHILSNIISTLLVYAFADGFLLLVYYITNLLRQPDYYLVANTHLIFNIVGVIIFMPLNKQFCKLLTKLYS